MKNSINQDEQDRVNILKEKISSIEIYLNVGEEKEIEFRISELRIKYLPDTIAIYESIPHTLRQGIRIDGTTAQSEFFKQLDLLNQALDGYTQKIQINRDKNLEKNRNFLEKIITTGILSQEQSVQSIQTQNNTTPEKLKNISLSKYLPSRMNPQEKIETQLDQKDMAKYALEKFSKNSYGNEKYYRVTSKHDVYFRPMVKGDYFDRFIFGLPGILLGFLFDISMGQTLISHNLFIFIVSIIIDVYLYVLSFMLFEIITIDTVIYKNLRYARGLAWLMTINHELVAPNVKREKIDVAAMKRPAFKNALKEYKPKMKKIIQCCLIDGIKEYQEEQNTGFFI